MNQKICSYQRDILEMVHASTKATTQPEYELICELLNDVIASDVE